MTGNQAHAQLWLLIENCTTRLYFLLTFLINLRGTFVVHVCNNKTFGFWAVSPTPRSCWGALLHPQVVVSTHQTQAALWMDTELTRMFGVPASLPTPCCSLTAVSALPCQDTAEFLGATRAVGALGTSAAG